VLSNPKIRRFGYRIDSVKTWQPVNWNYFFVQAAEIESIKKLTEDIEEFFLDLAKNKRLTPGLHNNSAIKSQIDWWESSERGTMLGKGRDALTADQNFIAGLRTLCNADINAARRHLSYDYFQRTLTDQQKERKVLTDYFDDLLQEMRKH